MPIDGGLGLLALAGAGYAARRLRRRGALAVLLALGAGGAQAQGAVLSPGDIAVTNFYTRYGGSGGGDNASFVLLVDIPQGTSFLLSDGAWDGTEIIEDSASDDPASFVAPCDIPAGTLFEFVFGQAGSNSSSTYDCPATSTDAASGFSSGVFDSVSSAGEQLLIYQNAATDPGTSTTGSGTDYLRFVYAVTTRMAFVAESGSIDDNTTKLPPLLDVGSTAIELPGANNVYRGIRNSNPTASLRNGSRGQLLLNIADIGSNWTSSNNSGAPALPQQLTFDVQGNGTTGTATAVGGPGWRALSVPGSGATVQTLVSANINFIQGLPNEHPTVDGTSTPLIPNVYVGYNGHNTDDERRLVAEGFGEDAFRSNNLGFVPANVETESIEPGKGVLWYFWDVDTDNFSNGTTDSQELPVLFPTVGSSITSDVTVTYTTEERRSASDNAVRPNDFYFLGNPFQSALDLSGLTETTAATLQSAFAFWNPNAGGAQVPAGNGTPGSYVIRNEVSSDSPAANDDADDVQVWQGFYACVSGATPSALPAFTFAASGRLQDDRPTFYGRTVASSRALVEFQLAGETPEGPTYDEASQIFFNELGAEGWDPYDLPSLGTLAWPVATLRPIETWANGERRPHMQRSLPSTLQGPLTTPLELTVAGASGAYSLTWTLRDLPEGWSVILDDLVTGQSVDLRTETAYDFSAELGASERFSLRVSPARPTATEGLPAQGDITLSPPVPNPASGSVRVLVSGLTESTAEVAVYDALGRRVAVLHRGVADRSTVLSLDTGDLAPGAYVIRASSGSSRTVQSLAVVR